MSPLVFFWLVIVLPNCVQWYFQMHGWFRPLSWALFITRCQTLQLSRCGSGFPGYYYIAFFQAFEIQNHSHVLRGCPPKKAVLCGWVLINGVVVRQPSLLRHTPHLLLPLPSGAVLARSQSHSGSGGARWGRVWNTCVVTVPSRPQVVFQTLTNNLQECWGGSGVMTTDVSYCYLQGEEWNVAVIPFLFQCMAQ